MKYLFYSIMLLFCLSACNTQIKQANKRGLEYMKQQRYEQAITEFNNILEEDPLWFPAYYNRAISYANTGNNKEALQDLNYVLANYPDNADAYFNRGIVYENLGLFSNAIKDYSETIQLRPDFIMAYHYRGIARFRMLDFNGALEDYNQALKLGKNVRMDVATAKEYGLNSSALYYNRGVLLQKKGDLQGAIQDYTQAINIDPASARSYYNRAIARLSLSMMEEAKSDLEIALHLGYKQANEVLQKYFTDNETTAVQTP